MTTRPCAGRSGQNVGLTAATMQGFEPQLRCWRGGEHAGESWPPGEQQQAATRQHPPSRAAQAATLAAPSLRRRDLAEGLSRAPSSASMTWRLRGLSSGIACAGRGSTAGKTPRGQDGSCAGRHGQPSLMRPMGAGGSSCRCSCLLQLACMCSKNNSKVVCSRGRGCSAQTCLLCHTPCRPAMQEQGVAPCEGKAHSSLTSSCHAAWPTRCWSDEPLPAMLVDGSKLGGRDGDCTQQPPPAGRA